MLARRRFMGGGESCPYQRIEYLERNAQSEGYPFIDTGYIPQGDDVDFEVTFSYNKGTSKSWDFILGLPVAANRIGYSIQRYIIDTTLYIYLASTNGVSQQNAIEGVSHNIQHNLKCLKTSKKIILDGVEREINERVPQVTPDIDNTTVTFKILDTVTGIYLKIYDLKLWKSGKIKLDLVPVRVGDEGFMYDKVSGRLLGNSGSGRFVLGPDLA